MTNNTASDTKERTEAFSKRYFEMPRSEIGHLRFILESYDGLAFARTLNRQIALVEIAYHPSRVRDVEPLLNALAGEVGLQEVAPPEDVPPL